MANIFGQNLSEAAVNAIKINATNVTNAEQKVVAATLGGDAFDMPAGAVNFSVGAEWRTAEAQYIPDEYLRSGDVVGFNPGLPTAGDISSKELFAEVRVPILADITLVKNLSLNGAYRSSGLRSRRCRPGLDLISMVSTGGSTSRSRSADSSSARHPRAEHRGSVRRSAAELPDADGSLLEPKYGIPDAGGATAVHRYRCAGGFGVLRLVCSRTTSFRRVPVAMWICRKKLPDTIATVSCLRPSSFRGWR